MTTVIWHRGQAWTFKDEESASDWLKEIEMAKAQKRRPKAPAEPVAEPPAAAIAEPALTIPACCADCDIQTEEGNTGGFFASHPARLGHRINGSFRHGEDTSAWLATIHAQES